MAISIVSGFLCFSSCDAAKAAKGQNPHPHADPAAKHGQKSIDAAGHQPAVIFGGTLKAPGNSDAAPTGADQSNDPTALH
jgi:hypothetical protein